MDQQVVFQPITKWTVRAEALATLPNIIRRALGVATTGNPGPVAVIVSTPYLRLRGISPSRRKLRWPSIRGSVWCLGPHLLSKRHNCS